MFFLIWQKASEIINFLSWQSSLNSTTQVTLREKTLADNNLSTSEFGYVKDADLQLYVGVVWDNVFGCYFSPSSQRRLSKLHSLIWDLPIVDRGAALEISILNNTPPLLSSLPLLFLFYCFPMGIFTSNSPNQHVFDAKCKAWNRSFSTGSVRSKSVSPFVDRVEGPQTSSE